MSTANLAELSHRSQTYDFLPAHKNNTVMRDYFSVTADKVANLS